MRKKIILASKSPRRQELIRGLELDFEIRTFEVDEDFPAYLTGHEIAVFLADKKAKAYPFDLNDEILITADTIVWINNKVLNKPENKEESFEMLRTICGKSHEVYTAVCFRYKSKFHTFYECSKVFCKNLSDEEIWHYIENYHPYDKAGSYGIQDWFGYTAVERIEGCFYNVMGLPVSRMNAELKMFDATL